MRTATIARKTNETEIALTLTLDGGREYENDTGCGFLNHMSLRKIRRCPHVHRTQI